MWNLNRKWSRDLSLRKTGLLELSDTAAAIEYWEEYTDWHYWAPYNHHVLAVLYARAGKFEEADRAAAVIEGQSYYARTIEIIAGAREANGE